MRRDPGVAGRTAASAATGTVPASDAGPDPAGAWIKEWRRLIPPPGVWWRKSAFDLARAQRANRLRPWRWLTEPVATFRIWLATGRLSPAARARWNRRAEAAAAADPLLSALDPNQRRAAACFEYRAMVTAGAGSGKTRTMVARAGYAARRLCTPPEAIAFITFTNKATKEIRQRTRERLPGLQVGTIHQLARRVLKLVDGRGLGARRVGAADHHADRGPPPSGAPTASGQDRRLQQGAAVALPARTAASAKPPRRARAGGVSLVAVRVSPSRRRIPRPSSRHCSTRFTTRPSTLFDTRLSWAPERREGRHEDD